MDSIIAVNKPKGPTSHDIVARIRKLTGVKKVGHAGTLDPLASGVLVIGIGRDATKKLGVIVNTEKEYRAVIELGAISKTDDSEGPIISRNVRARPDKEEICKILTSFEGRTKQLPPVYSALHINGARAYRLARGNKEVILSSREIEIKKIEIISYTWPKLEIKVVTGPGVYIRALARDIGERLSTGGYLKSLERTRVGRYDIEKSIKIEDIKHYEKTIL